jgi:hypothetical protein
MRPDGLPIVWLYLLPFLVVGAWVLVGGLLSVLGGWSRLATKYRSTAARPPGCHWLQSGRFGWVSYSNALTVGNTGAGLYLAVFFLLRLFHPPLLIPWTAITARRRVQMRFGFEFEEIEIDGVRIRLRPNLVAAGPDLQR